MPRSQSSHPHAANVLGALSLVVADQMNAATESVTTLGPSACAALVALHEFAGGGSVTQVSSVLGLSHSGTVRLLDRLGVEGLVERVGTPDGRVVSVVLTRAGRRTAARLLRARDATLARALSALSPAEVDSLATALDTMLSAITVARAEERAASTRGRSQPWLCRLCDFTACGRSAGRCPVDNAVSTNAVSTDNRQLEGQLPERPR